MDINSKPILMGVETGRVRTLPGFLKGGRHHEPDSHYDAAVSFIRKVGQDLVAERTERLFHDIRSIMGLKRKELSFHCLDGEGKIETPLFGMELLLHQEPTNPKLYLLETIVHPTSAVETLLQSDVLTILSGHITQVIYEWSQVPDLEETIDRIEDNDLLRDCLHYRADASELTLQPPGKSISLKLNGERAIFSMSPGGSLQELLVGAFELWPQVNPEENSSSTLTD